MHCTGSIQVNTRQTWMAECEKCPRSANIASEPAIIINPHIRSSWICCPYNRLSFTKKIKGIVSTFHCSIWYLSCIVEFHPRTSNHLSLFSLRTLACNMVKVLDKHGDSSEKYYIDRVLQCTIAMWWRLEQTRIPPGEFHNVEVQTSKLLRDK